METLSTSSPVKYKRVAFCGYARTGKDEAGRALINLGYTRVCFGDLIKADVNSLVKKHLGFSAFTQDDAEKKQIRPLLETWGDVNYEGIIKRFFDDLPEHAVNTRLVRSREAKMWLERGGGVIVVIKRPGVEPATRWEAEAFTQLVLDIGADNFFVIHNNGTVEALHAAVRQFVGAE